MIPRSPLLDFSGRFDSDCKIGLTLTRDTYDLKLPCEKCAEAGQKNLACFRLGVHNLFNQTYTWHKICGYHAGTIIEEYETLRPLFEVNLFCVADTEKA